MFKICLLEHKESDLQFLSAHLFMPSITALPSGCLCAHVQGLRMGHARLSHTHAYKCVFSLLGSNLLQHPLLHIPFHKVAGGGLKLSSAGPTLDT
jgi:hypothetical protein